MQVVAAICEEDATKKENHIYEGLHNLTQSTASNVQLNRARIKKKVRLREKGLLNRHMLMQLLISKCRKQVVIQLDQNALMLLPLLLDTKIFKIGLNWLNNIFLM